MESWIQKRIEGLKEVSEIYDRMANEPAFKDTKYALEYEMESQEFYKLANDMARAFNVKISEWL